MSTDGSKHAQMDANTASGADPRDIANDIYASILRGDKEVVMAPLALRIAILIRAFLPNVYFLIMQSRANKDKKTK